MKHKPFIYRSEHKMAALTILTLISGMLVLYLNYYRLSSPVEILRDLGSALLVAALVTLIYEAYARQRFAEQTIEDVLGKFVDDVVAPDVWRELRQQLLDKTAVRRTMQIRMQVLPREGLPVGQYVLHIEMSYRLASLRSYSAKVEVLHYLDAHIRNDKLGLPKFLRIEINGSVQPAADPFKQEVLLEGREGTEVPVFIEREELIQVPGTSVQIRFRSGEGPNGAEPL